jgi:hypothetical protein
MGSKGILILGTEEVGALLAKREEEVMAVVSQVARLTKARK